MKESLKSVRKFLASVVMTMAFVVSAVNMTPLTVSAQSADVVEVLKAELMENPEGGFNKNTRTMMTNCIISVGCGEEGMTIQISTGSVGTASVIGIKDIKVMKKVWYGWKTVAVSDGAEAYDISLVGINLRYANAEFGETYRVTCVHYANVTEYTEAENDTGGIVFTY